jgi:hypothetical protein
MNIRHRKRIFLMIRQEDKPCDFLLKPIGHVQVAVTVKPLLSPLLPPAQPFVQRVAGEVTEVTVENKIFG